MKYIQAIQKLTLARYGNDGFVSGVGMGRYMVESLWMQTLMVGAIHVDEVNWADRI